MTGNLRSLGQDRRYRREFRILCHHGRCSFERMNERQHSFRKRELRCGKRPEYNHSKRETIEQYN